MNFSQKVRRFFRAQSTLIHWLGGATRPLGFYIPYRYAQGATPLGSHEEIRWLAEHFEAELEFFDQHLELVRACNERLSAFTHADPRHPHQPRFNQEWFPGLDGAVAYGLVRALKPQRIIEIGSGHSTRFMTQAIRDGELSTHFHSVDPAPRRAIDDICSEVTRQTVDQFDPAKFLALAANDILFIDGSHIAMPGTDVDYLITQVLPGLASGVVVHIHDIFLPNGYPEDWRWRSYNEQSFLAALLSGGERYRVLLPNAYLRRHQPQLLENVCAPNPNNAHEASFWLRVT